MTEEGTIGPMKSNKRITHAYCVEAEEVLPITGARQFYFSTPRRGDLHFFCSTETCRKRGVKITGVNYHVPPQEQSTHQAAHYRANPVDDHDATCEWVGSEEDVGQRLSAESDRQLEERKTKQKLKDYIDIFDPNGDPAQQGDEPPSERPDSERGASTARERGGGQPPQMRHSTNSLERLVQCYRDAKEVLSKEEFEALTISVKGLGEIPLRSYFRPMEWARRGVNDRVLFGGARYKKFGAGFRFNFFDKHQGKPISLYVGSATINAYRYRRYWFELFNQSDNVVYFRIYALGSLVERDDGKGYDLVLDDLRHLAITLGPKKAD